MHDLTKVLEPNEREWYAVEAIDNRLNRSQNGLYAKSFRIG
jgi:hypothetical protein